jgi:Rieske Fe-S protein
MSQKTDRRTFIGTTAALAAATTLLPHITLAEGSGTLTADLGKVSDLDSGDPVYVEAQFRDADGKQVKEEKLYVRAVKDGNGGLNWVVLSAICTHLKCKLKYDSGDHLLHCPCHKSEFDLSGKVLKKPAKKDLPNFNKYVSMENGHLILTK